jgi:DNA-binding protein WhiA
VPSSLSADAKDALARTPVTAAHCRAALRDGLARFGADPSTGVFRTQRAAVARLAWSLLADRKSHAVRKVNETRLRRTPAYEVDGLTQPVAGTAGATATAGAAAEGTAVMEKTGTAAAAPRGGRSRCDRRMELRGAFLACGSLAVPARGYHLEFVPPPGEATARLLALLRAEGVRPKVAPRKGRRIVYFKDVDAIANVLAAIGASQAVFAIEDLRALKETKNRIHRLVNTEAANVDRAMSAAAAQREAIALLADAYGLQHLKAPLREVAQLRLAHPTETLAELGRRCEPPVKKSTVNNRVATLVRMARALPAGMRPQA